MSDVVRAQTIIAALAAACEAAEVPGLPDDASGVVDVDRNVHVGRFVSIEYADDVFVCEGDFAMLDEHTRFVADALEISLAGRDIRFIVAAPNEDPAACPSWAAGCLVERDLAVGPLWSAEHEINHAVTADHLGSVTVWKEGLAVAYEPRRLIPGLSHPMLLLDRHGEAVPYETSGHFVRHLLGDVGPEKVLELTSSQPGEGIDASAAAFASVLGEDMESYGSRYLADAEPLESLHPIPDPLPWTGSRWLQVLQLDCGEPHTRAALDNELLPDGLEREVVLQVSEAGAYELAVSRGTASLERIVPASTSDYGAIWSTDEESPRLIEAEAGTYVLTVRTNERDASMVAVELRPKLGPTPAD